MPVVGFYQIQWYRKKKQKIRNKELGITVHNVFDANGLLFQM